jgi:5-methyltetrahydrofolate--homocysteine methyltransferase
LGGLGADGLGINCSVGPKEIYPMVEELQRWTTLPLAVKPNAGLPTVVDGETIYQTTAEAFEKEMQKIAGLGVFALGGCCGTTPEFIRRLSPLAGSFRSARQKETPAAVCSSAQVVCFDEFRVVGDRISPAGEEIRNAIREQDMDTLVDEALSQVDDGADLIGVEVGIPAVDEAVTMREAVSALQSMTSAPLCLISGDLAALEAGLRQYHGKAMVYVPCAAEAKREDLWRLAGKYGAAAMVSVAEENEKVSAAEWCLRAETMAEAAVSHGIQRNDLFVALSSGQISDMEAAETLQAIRLAGKQGLKTGISLSRCFGKQDKTEAFLQQARENGLDLAICNPE